MKMNNLKGTNITLWLALCLCSQFNSTTPENILLFSNYYHLIIVYHEFNVSMTPHRLSQLSEHWCVISICVCDWCVGKHTLRITVACWADEDFPSCFTFSHFSLLLVFHLTLVFQWLSVYVHYACPVLWIYVCNVNRPHPAFTDIFWVLLACIQRQCGPVKHLFWGGFLLEFGGKIFHSK